MPTVNKRQTVGQIDIIEGTGNPADAPGIEANTGSLFLSTDLASPQAPVQTYTKTGSGDQDWARQ